MRHALPTASLLVTVGPRQRESSSMMAAAYPYEVISGDQSADLLIGRRPESDRSRTGRDPHVRPQVPCDVGHRPRGGHEHEEAAKPVTAEPTPLSALVAPAGRSTVRPQGSQTVP